MTVLQIPILESERIRLEPLSRSHSEGMFRLWCESAVCEFAGPSFDSDARPIKLPADSPLESDRLLQFWLERSLNGTGFRWAATLLGTSTFVGAVGFNALGSCAEYAYHFIPKFWGAGLASESSQLALSWIFSQDTELVELFIEQDNLKSLRMAERLGFRMPTRSTDGLLRYELLKNEHAA